VHHFLGACMNADRTALDAHARVAADAIAARPHHIATAADRGRIDAVRLMVEVGFDVNTPDHSLPHRATALHYAALNGSAELAAVLRDLGADPTLKDASFNATPAGWADHAGHPELAELLSAAEAADPL
jgi:ankyrin repeat protein